MRLNKFISESGICSRREADRFISEGKVFINGRKAVIGDQVAVGDRVKVNGMQLEPRVGEDIVFIALNKPPGITSTSEPGVKDNIVDFVNHSKRIFPIGRLDKDSQGLIFLTNDGDMVNKILRAGNRHEKEYLVTVDKVLTDKAIEGMANGVPMLGVTTKKCRIVKEGNTVFRITLIQGLNRQIRRMCEYFGYEVLKLERVRIMHINLKGIPLGEWRELSASEMETMYTMVEESSSEVDQRKKASKAKDKKRDNSTVNTGKPVSGHAGNKSSNGKKGHSGHWSGDHRKGKGQGKNGNRKGGGRRGR